MRKTDGDSDTHKLMTLVKAGTHPNWRDHRRIGAGGFRNAMMSMRKVSPDSAAGATNRSKPPAKIAGFPRPNVCTCAI